MVSHLMMRLMSVLKLRFNLFRNRVISVLLNGRVSVLGRRLKSWMVWVGLCIRVLRLMVVLDLRWVWSWLAVRPTLLLLRLMVLIRL